MENETRNCQNCKKDFVIDSEDFNFYEKIKVPLPTFCPECRLIRRMMATNERFLYKRKCDLSGEEIFAMYPGDTKFPVYCTDEWYSDKWDPYQYGMEYDFSRTFFEQFLELQNKVPRMALVRQGFSINSPYTHRVTDPKNSYMVFRASYPENSLYTYIGMKIKDVCDCSFVTECELCYECINCERCYGLKYSQENKDCRDSMFLYMCRNCSNCVGCVNLVNQSFCILNEKYSEEDYKRKLKELKLNSFTGVSNFEKQFYEFRKKFPQKAVVSIKSDDVSGNWFSNSKNVKESFDCVGMKDGKYLFSIFYSEDCMDYFQWGNKAEQIYESENCGLNIARLSFCMQCWTGATDLIYCNSCPSSHDCFGCVGLKKGEYSILNKKYSKEEYEKLLPKIKQHMMDMPYYDGDIKYCFGEHFPNSLSEFAYNETAAGDFFPLSKEEVEKRGYKWKDREKRTYVTTIKSSDLPDTISEVNDSIINEVIECEEKDSVHSVGAYRITTNELAFYRRMDIPLPRVCFDVRHMRRFEKRPVLLLHNRNCSKCNIEVSTVYTKDYAPIIYCEECYKQEVY